MSLEEFNEWALYYEEEPWGCLVDDHRMDSLLSLLFAVNSKPGSQIPHWFDRRPDVTAERLNRVSTDDEIEAMFDGMIARQTAQDT